MYETKGSSESCNSCKRSVNGFTGVKNFRLFHLANLSILYFEFYTRASWVSEPPVPSVGWLSASLAMLTFEMASNETTESRTTGIALHTYQR